MAFIHQHITEPLGTYFTFNNDPKKIVDQFIRIAKRKETLKFDYEDDYDDDDYDEDYDEDYDDDYVSIDNPKILHRADCFDLYWDIYSDNRFCFGFTHLPIWIDKVVEQFNQEFKNIKVNILGGTEYGYKQTKTIWNTAFMEFSEDLEDVDWKVASRFFTIDFSEKYSLESIIYLRYIVHHVFRMFSLLEVWAEYLDEVPDMDLLQYILNINNEGPGYRTLSEKEITKEELLKIDDIGAVNNAAIYLQRVDYVKQTLILLAVNNMINTEPLELGNIVELIPEHACLDFMNQINKEFRVVEVHGNSVTIRDIQNPTYIYYFLNTIHFRHVIEEN